MAMVLATPGLLPHFLRFVTFIDTLSVLQGMVYILMDSEGPGTPERAGAVADGDHAVS